MRNSCLTGKSKAHIVQRATAVLTARTHYEALGVPVTASRDTIKSAHRELAGLFHPDRCVLDAAHDVMSRVNQAYACLSDKESKRLYDTINKIQRRTCDACGGKGYRFKQQGFGKRLRTPCDNCGGSGQC
jgi:DnaJ-class molecular chaperone